MVKVVADGHRVRSAHPIGRPERSPPQLCPEPSCAGTSPWKTTASTHQMRQTARSGSCANPGFDRTPAGFVRRFGGFVRRSGGFVRGFSGRNV